MATLIQYKTKMSSFTKGGKVCYSAQPIHNGTVYRSDIVAKVAEISGSDARTVDYILGLCIDQIGEELSNGMHVECGDIAGNLSIQGGFPTKDSGWDTNRNTLVPNLHAKGNLAKCTSGIVCENVTACATVIIKSVVDTVHKTESEIMTGSNVVIYVAGTGLLTSTDPASGEGVWFEDYATGIVAATGTVTGSMATTLDATFATMPEPGTYWFVVASRGGLGEEYGIVQAKRKVTVISAA